MFSSLADLVLSLRVSYHNILKFDDFTITARRRWSIEWRVQLRLNSVWHGIRSEVCANHPHWLCRLSLSTFLDFIIHVWRTMRLCATTFNDDWHYFSYCFFLVCCRLCMTGWFLCFWRRSMLELGGTFFIAMLKLAPFVIRGGGDAMWISAWLWEGN